MGIRILIGSCGGLTGIYLARQFGKIPGCYVIGADIDFKNGAHYFTDEFVTLPPANSSDFVDELIALLLEKKVDCYLPTHSREMCEVSRNESIIRKGWPGAFIVSPYETFQKLDNKCVANRNLHAIGIPVPRLIKDGEAFESYPIFMKPNEGSGSNKAMAIENRALHQLYHEMDPTCSFYELIKGPEYTVDCIFDTDGRLIAYNQRMRIKRMGGAVITTQNNYDFDIFPWLKKLEKSFTFKGCINFQYILSNGTPYFIDVNLRYASGGLPLTVASGINIPQILLDILLKRPIPKIQSCPANGKIMYRYFNEIFEDEKL